MTAPYTLYSAITGFVLCAWLIQPPPGQITLDLTGDVHVVMPADMADVAADVTSGHRTGQHPGYARPPKASHRESNGPRNQHQAGL